MSPHGYFAIMDTMYRQIARTIDKFDLLNNGDSVLVALSGGPDSVGLLHLLYGLRDKYGISLAVAHLDHGLRKESAGDREFCRVLCRGLKVKFHAQKIDVAALAKRAKLSIEEAGRRQRYAYFQSLAEKYKYDKITTGHTADDNLETVIFNMARGSGLAGLRGIPAKRDNIIRPLIEIRKTEIIRWLKANRIDFRIDRTNRSLSYARNRIRHKIAPELEKLNRGAVGNITRLSQNIAEEIEFIDSMVVSAYERALVEAGKSKIVLDLAKIKDYDEKLRKKLVIEAYFRMGGDFYRPSFEVLTGATQVLDGRSGGRSDLGRGIWIEKSKGVVSIFKPGSKKGEVKLVIPGRTEIPSSDLFLETAILRRGEVKRLRTSPDQALLDRGLISDVAVRYWRDGDKIRPFGMRGRRLLSDIFSERGIPSYQRRGVPLLISRGKIVWIAGIMISDDFKVGPETDQVLSVRLCGRS